MTKESAITISVQQVASTGDPEANSEIARDAIRRGAESGARVVVLPEAMHVRFGVDAVPFAEDLDGPWAGAIREAARHHDVYVVAGMFRPSGDGRILNTALVTGPGIHTGYDKIHLYDAYGFAESDRISPGDTPLVFDVDGITIGIATCYDIRFPELFRTYADLGASVVVVPTHWGAGEGKLEAWRLLSQARALDSTLWVVTCGQPDPEEAGVEVPPGPGFGIGHSMAVDPMGRIVEELGSGPGEFRVTVDHESVDRAREVIPVLAGRRLTTGGASGG